MSTWAEAVLRTEMRVSVALSCGCSTRVSAPMPAREAPAAPGSVVICDVHDEWAVVTRVTTRLVATPEVLRRLLVAAGVPDHDADYVADAHAQHSSDGGPS